MLLDGVRLHPPPFMNRLNESHTPRTLTRELTLYSTLNGPLVLSLINANILFSDLGEQLLPGISSEEKCVEEGEDEILSVSPLVSIKEVGFEKKEGDKVWLVVNIKELLAVAGWA